MRDKKAQAAMEFLMTYGWAILAAVIVIGVLAYFGVFSPGTYVPNQCTLSAPIGCEAGVADSGQVSLDIRNGAGQEITITSIKVVGCATDSTSRVAADGSLTNVTITCSPTLSSGKFQGNLEVNYTKSGTGSGLTLSSNGRLVDKV